MCDTAVILEAKEGSESISLAATLCNPFVPQTERLNNVSIKRPKGVAVFRVIPAYMLLCEKTRLIFHI